MRLLLIGAPGAGKGTQAFLLAQHFGITHISSGDLLRKHIAESTSLGRTIRHYVERGDLVPDQLVMDMLRKPVVAANSKGGYVLDGFPRTVGQAEAAYLAARDLGVAVQIAAHLEVDHDELVRRLLSRNRGPEDTQEVIDHRLQVYEKQTRPMLAYYAQREILLVVDGTRSIEQVSQSLQTQIGRVQHLLRD
jgi:adenylate kinase